MRKILTTMKNAAGKFGIAGWRQAEHLLDTIKKKVLIIQRLKRSTSKVETKIVLKDEKVAVSILEGTKKVYPQIKQASFDKGFYSVDNKTSLEQIVDRLIMTRKGKLTKVEKELERDKEYVQARNEHRAVESGISALINRGLDRCLDHGIEGLCRYAAFSVTARNLQILGSRVVEKEIRKLERLKSKQNRNKAA